MISDGGGHISDEGGTDVLVFPFASTEVNSTNLLIEIRSDDLWLSGDLLNANTVRITDSVVERFRFQDDVEWSLTQLQAAVVPPDDFSADDMTTGRITVGTPVTGEVEVAHDHDWFAIELQAGGLYRIDLEGTRTGMGTLSDPYLRGIFDSTGTLLPGTQNDDAGEGYNSLVWFNAVAAGTHYISAGAYGSYVGTYKLSVQQMVDDYSAGTDTTGQVAVGGQTTGAIDAPNDRDWFAVELTEGVAYRIDLRGESSGGGDLRRPVLSDLVDGNGNPLVGTGNQRGGQGNDSRSEFVATETGTHYIVASGSGPTTGSYTVQVAELVQVMGTAGDDWLNLPNTGSAGLYGIRGSTGTDMMSFADLDAGIYVNTHTDRVVSTFASSPLDLVMDSIENVTGTGHADVFVGSDRAETFRGLGGNDSFYGSDGGRDVYQGGSGRDLLSYVYSTDGISVSLLRGRGISGDAHQDVITGIEDVTGSFHDDIIWGDHGANKLRGGAGDDMLIGNGGDDYLLGGFGQDVVLYAGNQADYQIRQDGAATWVTDLAGGAGTDLIGQVEILRFADGDLML
jgi:hypothetical protein